MKKLILSSMAMSFLFVGCATRTTTTTTPGGGVTKEEVKQSDSATMSFLTGGVGIVQDIIKLVLPPIIPIITKKISSPVVGSDTATATK